MTGSAEKCPLDTNEVERYNCMAEPGFSLRGVVRGEWGDVGRDRSQKGGWRISQSSVFACVLQCFLHLGGHNFHMLLSWPT